MKCESFRCENKDAIVNITWEEDEDDRRSANVCDDHAQEFFETLMNRHKNFTVYFLPDIKESDIAEVELADKLNEGHE